MAQVIKIKRSAVAAKVPATTDLALGELAMNTNDGKLFMKKNNGTDAIVEIGAAQTASNVGATGVGVFNQKTGNNFEFKKLVAGTNMTVTDNGTTVTLASTASGGGGGGSNPANSSALGWFTFSATLAGTTTVASTSNLPANWGITIGSAGVLTVNHTVGQAPVMVVLYGLASTTYKPAYASNASAVFAIPDAGGGVLSTTQFNVTVTGTTSGGSGNSTVIVRVLF